MEEMTLHTQESLSRPLPMPEHRTEEQPNSNLDDVIVCKLLAELGEYANLTGILATLTEDSTYLLELAGGSLGGLDTLLSGGMEKLPGALYELVNGNRVLKDRLPAISGENADLATLNALNGSLQHLAVQQQMAAFASELEEQHEAIRRIEAGQKEDRFGEILGARELLYMAARAEDEESRKSLTRSAIQQLTTATGKIRMAVQSRSLNFEEVPKNPMLMAWRMVTTPGDYAEKKDREYNELKDYVDFLRTADSLKAAAYRMIDEPRLADEVFALQEAFWQTVDLKRVQSICNMYHEVDFSEEWSFAPKKLLERDRAKLAEAASGPVTLKLTGKQLKEAMKK